MGFITSAHSNQWFILHLMYIACKKKKSLMTILLNFCQRWTFMCFHNKINPSQRKTTDVNCVLSERSIKQSFRSPRKKVLKKETRMKEISHRYLFPVSESGVGR